VRAVLCARRCRRADARRRQEGRSVAPTTVEQRTACAAPLPRDPRCRISTAPRSLRDAAAAARGARVKARQRKNRKMPSTARAARRGENKLLRKHKRYENAARYAKRRCVQRNMRGAHGAYYAARKVKISARREARASARDVAARFAIIVFRFVVAAFHPSSHYPRRRFRHCHISPRRALFSSSRHAIGPSPPEAAVFIFARPVSPFFTPCCHAPRQRMLRATR